MTSINLEFTGYPMGRARFSAVARIALAETPSLPTVDIGQMVFPMRPLQRSLRSKITGLFIRDRGGELIAVEDDLIAHDLGRYVAGRYWSCISVLLYAKWLGERNGEHSHAAKIYAALGEASYRTLSARAA